LGGLTWTDERLGTTLELGGTFVHWYQPHVWSEITRYNLEVIPSAQVKQVQWITDGQLRTGSHKQFRTLLEKSFEPLMRDSEKLLPDPYNPDDQPSFSAHDHQSVADYLDNLNLPQEKHDLL